MNLTAYLHPGWGPLIRPAPVSRAWMDAAPEAFAYRCLPLNIANAHGWEILNPCGFEAVWNGGGGPDAITIVPDANGDVQRVAVSLFGQGVITFHVEGIFRTPPGWNLWIGGSPNRAKDAIAPLTGIIETDWSPYTFTMNWRFTRPNQPVRFEALEPFGFLFPLQRGAIEIFEPAFAPLGADPETETRFRAWSQARDEFHARMQTEQPKAPADRWQKHYYRGVDVNGESLVDDHRAKLRLKPFDRSASPDVPAPPKDDLPVVAIPLQAVPQQAAAPAGAAEKIAALQRLLAKREWLLETLERQRDLAPAIAGIERRPGLGTDEFLESYYAPGRPVILTREMVDWPALSRWTPGYLKAKVGPAIVEYQGDRLGNAQFELEKDRHRRQAPFTEFIDAIQGGTGNNAYLTAYNSETNRQALAPLARDMGYLDKFLTHGDTPGGMMWIGPAGTLTSLHHDLTNNFIAQIVGRKRLKLAPASEVGRIYNHRHVFSEISDLDDPSIDLKRYPNLVGMRTYDVELAAGEILFVPLAWWHQVKGLDFSVTVTYTNFLWPNDGHQNYPAD